MNTEPNDQPVASEVSDMNEATPIEQVPVTPKPRKPRKASGKGNGASKPVKAAPAAPKAKKAASKPLKAKAKAKKAVGRPADGVPRDQFGFSLNSIKSKAAAMYASKHGATLGEVKDKLKSVQLNLLSALEEKGFKVSRVKEAGDGARQVTRYFLRAK